MVNTKMNYEEFKAEFSTRLIDLLEEKGYEVSLLPVMKENGLEMDGLSIRKEGPVGPTVYLQPLFDELNEGMQVEVLLQRVARDVEKMFSNLPQPPAINRQEAEQRLFPVVVNYEANKRLLKDLPHRVFADGELAYYARWKVDVPEGEASFKVNNQVLAQAQMSQDECLDVALVNARGTYQVRAMGEVLMEMMGEDLPEEMKAEMLSGQPELYFVSNQEKKNGAAFLADKEELAKIAEQYNAYIILSSRHECLLVPKGNADIRELEEMVRSVNANEVSREDFLSNSVFEIGKGNKLVVAKESVATENLANEIGIHHNR